MDIRVGCCSTGRLRTLYTTKRSRAKAAEIDIFYQLSSLPPIFIDRKEQSRERIPHDTLDLG